MPEQFACVMAPRVDIRHMAWKWGHEIIRVLATSIPGPSRWDGDEDPGKIRFIVPKFWEKNRMRSETQPYSTVLQYGCVALRMRLFPQNFGTIKWILPGSSSPSHREGPGIEVGVLVEVPHLDKFHLWWHLCTIWQKLRMQPFHYATKFAVVSSIFDVVCWKPVDMLKTR